MGMIPCNNLAQAVKELATFNLQGYEPRQEIQEAEKGHYLCACIMSRDNADGTAKIHEVKEVFANQKKWFQMEEQVKHKIVKGMFNGMFNRVVILHNPTLKEAPKTEKPKPETTTKSLSPAQKKAVKEMLEQGAGVQEIAHDLQIEVERIEAFTASL